MYLAPDANQYQGQQKNLNQSGTPFEYLHLPARHWCQVHCNRIGRGVKDIDHGVCHSHDHDGIGVGDPHTCHKDFGHHCVSKVFIAILSNRKQMRTSVRTTWNMQIETVLSTDLFGFTSPNNQKYQQYCKHDHLACSERFWCRAWSYFKVTSASIPCFIIVHSILECLSGNSSISLPYSGI